MFSSDGTSSFSRRISDHISEFIDKILKIYQDQGFQPQWNSEEAHTIIFKELLQEHPNQMQNQSLSDFLKSTINNELEKRRKRIFCIQSFKSSSSGLLFDTVNKSISGKQTENYNLLQSGNNFNSIHSLNRYHDIQSSGPSSIVQSIINRKEVDHQKNRIGLPEPGLKPGFALGSFSQSLSSINSQKTYKTYSLQKKKEVIEYAEMNGIKSASFLYNIPPSKINLWIKQLNEEKQTRGRKPIDPDMEEKVYIWLQQELNKGVTITQKIIREKAKSMSKSQDFKASKGWLQKFFKRRPELFQKYTKNRRTLEIVFKEGEKHEKIEQNLQDCEQKQNEIIKGEHLPLKIEGDIFEQEDIE